MRVPVVAERQRLIEEEHARGHFGRQAIFRALFERRVWWPGMYEDVQGHLHSCSECLKVNIAKHGYHPARAVRSSLPGDHWQMDVAHMPDSGDGMTRLLILVDVFTSFVVLRPMVDETAETTAQTLFEVFALLGQPRIL